MSESEKAMQALVAGLPAAIAAPENCRHEEFAATVTVARIEDSGKFMCEARVICVHCREPFRFIGLDAGVNWGRPTASIDGLELIAPIEPEGEKRLMDRASYQMPNIPVRH